VIVSVPSFVTSTSKYASVPSLPSPRKHATCSAQHEHRPRQQSTLSVPPQRLDTSSQSLRPEGIQPDLTFKANVTLESTREKVTDRVSILAPNSLFKTNRCHFESARRPRVAPLAVLANPAASQRLPDNSRGSTPPPKTLKPPMHHNLFSRPPGGPSESCCFSAAPRRFRRIYLPTQDTKCRPISHIEPQRIKSPGDVFKSFLQHPVVYIRQEVPAPLSTKLNN
jgi:hypothetical protein